MNTLTEEFCKPLSREDASLAWEILTGLHVKTLRAHQGIFLIVEGL